MNKIRIILIFFVTIITCSCTLEKLPKNENNSLHLKKLADFYLILEQNQLNLATGILESERNLDLKEKYSTLYCFYTSRSCSSRNLNNGESEDHFVQAIFHIKKREFDSLNVLAASLAKHSEQIFKHGDMNSLISIDKDENKKKDECLSRLAPLFKKAADFNTEQLFFLIMDLSNLSTYFYLNYQENAASAINNLIFHLIKKYELANLYPSAISDILANSSPLYIVADKDLELAKEIVNDVIRIDSMVPDNISFNKISHKIDFLNAHSKDYSFDKIVNYVEDLLLNDGLDKYQKANIYLNVAYIIKDFHEEIDNDKIRSKSIEYLNNVIGLLNDDFCTANYIFAAEYLTILLTEESIIERKDAKIYEIDDILSKLRKCQSLEAHLELSYLRIEEKLSWIRCQNSTLNSACVLAYDVTLLMDSIVEANFQDQYELHKSDYYAFVAKEKFKYLDEIHKQNLEDKWLEKSLYQLQNTKYRIFNYRNNYAKIFSAEKLNKIENFEESISDLNISLASFDNFIGPTKDYIKLVDLNLKKLELFNQQGSENIANGEINYSIKNIQNQLLIQNSQAIEFYQYEDKLRIFVMNPDTFYHEAILLDSSLDASVAKLKDHQRNPTSDTIDLNPIRSHIYSSLLSEHLDTSFKNLIIIPDGILNGIAFEALIDENDQPLLETFNTSYAFGINAASKWNSNSKQFRKATFVSFTDEKTLKDKAKKEYLELTGAFKEVNNCADLLAHAKSRIYSGNQCTEKNINKALLSDIAHIATHAVSDPENNIGNYMVTRSGKNTQKTYGYEFNNKNSNATLAILSACETGIGKFEAGEGVFSLSRNLQQSGIPSVIKTLWKVDDESSHYLMEYFYEAIKDGANFSAALRTAKQKYMRYHDTDPYFWSGYVLEGNPYTSFSFSE